MERQEKAAIDAATTGAEYKYKEKINGAFDYVRQVTFMQSKASFNFSQSKSLVNKINSCKAQLNAALGDLEREISDTPSWWEGESQAAFYEGYRCAVSGIASRLEMMTELSSYITRVSNDKDNFEAKGKKRF